MRIIQLTDLHLGREGDDSHGVDVRQNFLNLLEKIPAYDADELIITGDLCLNEGDVIVYQWIYEQLEPLGLPVSLHLFFRRTGEESRGRRASLIHSPLAFNSARRSAF